jgi:hypothetical protein
MFTCEKCHLQRPGAERVVVGRCTCLLAGLLAPVKATVICRRCSKRVFELRSVAIAGLVVVGAVTVLVLHLAAKF